MVTPKPPSLREVSRLRRDGGSLRNIAVMMKYAEIRRRAIRPTSAKPNVVRPYGYARKVRVRTNRGRDDIRLRRSRGLAPAANKWFTVMMKYAKIRRRAIRPTSAKPNVVRPYG